MRLAATRPYLLCAAAALILTGCTAAFLNTAAHGIFSQKDVNLREKNYAAADYLIGQAQTFIGRNDYIFVEPLGDVNQPSMTSDLSKMIPEQIGIRMSQLGYNMNLERVATGPDTNYLKPPASLKKEPAFILTGSYLRNRVDMDVSMRMVDARSARVIATYDYKLPLNRQISELAAPQAKIIRLPQTQSGAPAPAVISEPLSP